MIIDGLTPSMLEDTLERGSAPALALLADHGRYRRAVSTFPSLTPVCLSSLATGAHPDVHEIPHLVWYHRGERRLVEYGSSFGAVRAAGTRQSLVDTVYGLNASHLGRRAVTVYEALEDAGLVAAAVNITCYRGRTEHRPTVPFLTRPALGPSRFFFYNLFQSDVTGAPLSVRNRPRGTIDAYATAVGRWLVTRDGFDFLVFYLSDYDYASHAQGPDAAHAALARCDDAVGTLIAAAGGPDEFLERYAVILCSDHGQTTVQDVARLQDTFPEAIVTASNRAGMVYTDAADLRPLATRLDGNPAVDVVLWREGEEAVARRDGEELRFTPTRHEWRRLDPRSSGRPRTGLGRARKSERGRADRLRGCRLGVRRPRRSQPRGRRLARLASDRGLGGADAGGRPRRPAGVDRGGDAGCARPLRRRCPRVRPCARTRMRTAAQLAEYLRRRGISDERVLAAIERVPRELFVPEGLRRSAFDDRALPIGHGQTISQPFMVATICAALELEGDERVLDVGTGSGYQAAVLAELADEVVTVERVPELADRARVTLERAGYGRVDVRVGDGTLGVPDRAPYDAIAVAAAAPGVPEALYEQLAPGGRIVLPVGSLHDQWLEVVVRGPQGPVVERSVPCRFVPLIGSAGFAEQGAG